MFFKPKKIVHQTQIYVKLPTNPKKYWSCVWIFWWILDQLCCYCWDLSCWFGFTGRRRCDVVVDLVVTLARRVMGEVQWCSHLVPRMPESIGKLVGNNDAFKDVTVFLEVSNKHFRPCCCVL